WAVVGRGIGARHRDPEVLAGNRKPLRLSRESLRGARGRPRLPVPAPGRGRVVRAGRDSVHRGDAGGGLDLTVPRGGGRPDRPDGRLRPLQHPRRRYRLRGPEGPEKRRTDKM
ncbi:MAG: Substrate-specific component ThiW of predicted thiazole ECF transporter, partial [uncultured Rubrobacteraceae bacterium]